MAGKHSGFQVKDSDDPLIARLKPNYQEAVRFQGTDQELADLIKAPIGTAKSRRNRARTALQMLRDERAGIRAGG